MVGEVTSKSTVSLPTHILTYSCVCFHVPPPSKHSHALMYTGSHFNLSSQSVSVVLITQRAAEVEGKAVVSFAISQVGTCGGGGGNVPAGLKGLISPS